jgi:hypothetical protein
MLARANVAVTPARANIAVTPARDNIAVTPARDTVAVTVSGARRDIPWRPARANAGVDGHAASPGPAARRAPGGGRRARAPPAPPPRSLWRMGTLRSLALDMVLNHLAERRQLELWLKGVEAAWRAEEELARIMDDELS